MMPQNSILQKYLALEDDPAILDFRFDHDGILMWPFIRHELMWDLLRKERKLADPWNREKGNRLISQLCHSWPGIIKNPLLVQRHYPIVMMHGTYGNVLRGKKYYNRVADFFASEYTNSTLIMEQLFAGRYFIPRSFPNVCYWDYMLRLFCWGRGRYAISRKDRQSAAALVQHLKTKSPFELNGIAIKHVEHTLSSLARRLGAIHLFYNKLFDKIRPKIIFLALASYGKTSYILKWAKDRGIVTAELQHGNIPASHIAYNYGEAIIHSSGYKKYLPDHFLMYGMFWAQSINVPVSRVMIGNPVHDEALKRHRENPDRNRVARKKRILNIFEYFMFYPFSK